MNGNAEQSWMAGYGCGSATSVTRVEETRAASPSGEQYAKQQTKGATIPVPCCVWPCSWGGTLQAEREVAANEKRHDRPEEEP